MKNLYCIILLAACAACSLFKNSSRQVNQEKAAAKRNSTLNTELNKESKINAGSVLLINDSTDNSFFMQLWPKGVFTYSPVLGFRGEAEKVLISGKLKQGTSISKKEDLTSETSSTQKIDAVDNAQVNTEHNQKELHTEVSWKTIVMALLVFAAAGCWMLKSFNRKL